MSSLSFVGFFIFYFFIFKVKSFYFVDESFFNKSLILF